MDARGAPRALVADEQPLLRLGIRGELEDAGFTVCAEAGDARAALVAALRHEPDVCLIDVRLPGGGFEAARDISSRLLQTKILLLAGDGVDTSFVEALEAGAAGYVEKALDPGRLPRIVAAVCDGEPVIPRRDVRKLLEHGRTRALTSAEREPEASLEGEAEAVANAVPTRCAAPDEWLWQAPRRRSSAGRPDRRSRKT